MIHLLPLFFLVSGSKSLPLEKLYVPPGRYNVALASDGSLYYLTAENQVVHLDPSGKTLQSFAGSGNGPDELAVPMAMSWDRGSLWVMDLNFGIKRFDSEGHLVQTIKVPGTTPFFAQWGEGWIWLDHSSLPGIKAEVVQYDPKTRKHKGLYEWMPEWSHATQAVRTSQGTLPYNPAMENVFFVVDSPRGFAYVVPPGPTLKILVMAQGKPMRTLQFADRPIPFNLDWGKSMMRKATTPGTHLALDAPKHFPIAKNLTVTPDGYLVLEKWTYDPDVAQSFSVLDSNGKVSELGYRPEHASRVLFIQKGIAYLSAYSSEKDHASILLCSVEAVEIACTHNPIRYEERKGTWVNLAP